MLFFLFLFKNIQFNIILNDLVVVLSQINNIIFSQLPLQSVCQASECDT